MLFYKKKKTIIRFENEFTKEVKNETDSEVDVQSIKSCTLSDTINPANMPPADPELGNLNSTFVDPELCDSKSTFINPELGDSKSTFVDPELGNSKSIFVDPELGNSKSTFVNSELDSSKSTCMSRTERKL